MATEETQPIQPTTLTSEQQNRKLVIPFCSQVGATTGLTLGSSKIDLHYKVTNIEIHFGDDHANNVQISVHIDDNSGTPTATQPSGVNLISRFSPSPYAIGNGETTNLECFYIPSFYENYIKVYANNTNAYAVDVAVYVTIESLSDAEIEGLEQGQVVDYAIKATDEYTTEMINKATASIKMADETLKGTYPQMVQPIAEWISDVGDAIGKHQARYMNAMNVVSSIPVGVPKEDRYKFTKAWLDNAVNVTKDLNFESSLIQAVTGVFGASVKDWSIFLESVFGLQGKCDKLLDIAFDKGMYKPVEQYWNKMYQPEYPSTADLIEMVVKEVLPVKDFQEIMTYHGYSHFWSQKIWDAHFINPNYEQMREALWRGGINDTEWREYAKRVDLDPRYNDTVWDVLKYNVPPYSDLTNMRVKEVITQEQFKEGLKNQGFVGDWAERIWQAHFQPPTFMDFLTAFRRKETVTVPKADGTTYSHTFGSDFDKDMQVIQELSILVDYDDRYWTFFKTRMYDDPSPRQARWGYEEGALTEEDVYDLSLRSGLKPEDAKWFTQMQVGFQERPFITRYLNGLMNLYLKKVIDADELTKRVEAIPRRKAVADWIIKIADLNTEMQDAKEDLTKEKLLSVSDLKTMFTYGLISEDDLRTRLQLLGYELTDIQLLIQLTERKKEEKESGAQKRKLSVSEMFNAFKWWQISENELRTDLMLRGLTLQESQLLIDTKKMQWVIKDKWSETQPTEGFD